MIERTVPKPEVLTYTAKVGFKGREESYPIDAEIAKEEPELMILWRKYLQEKGEYENEKNARVMRAMIYDATEPPDNFLASNPAWMRRMRAIGMNLSEDDMELWVDFVTLGGVDEEDLSGLYIAIMKTSITDEGLIKEIEDSFRDSVSTEQGDEQGSEEDSGGNEGDETRGEVAAQ